MVSEKIQSLDQLLEVLPQCSGSDYVDIAKDMELNAEDLLPYAFWSKEFYTRNCLARSDDYELLLLCWEPGQETPIHGHGGQECWVYLVQGLIEEFRYDLEEEPAIQLNNKQRVLLRESKLSYMNDDMGLHSLKNISEGRAMTLHLYMNPIDKCRIYDPSTKKLSWMETEYHSFKGKKLSDKIAK
ncbi:MAG: cysteine dioxygenase family protein [Chitinophagales bacterium]